jgi:hypothetical protein
MNSTAISLGWDCGPAYEGIVLNLKTNKENGYKTCPFDICVTNYTGIVNCIKDDFKYLMDSNYLEVMKAEIQTPNNSVQIGDKLIRNTKYNLVFNHESPEHGNLWNQEKWSNGQYHYVVNDFKELKERYNRRVTNFREYIKTHYVTFIISRFNTDLSALKEALKQTYNLDYGTHYTILRITPNCSVDFMISHLILCKVPENELKEEASS